jgi:trk system potassium uptake protein TrkA
MDHTVAVIDRREKAFTRLGEGFRGKKVVGVGFDRDRLVDAGIEHADALAAVTNGDNSNILVARVARETYGIERVVARIYDPRRAAIYERVGIPTIATVQWATERVLHRILPDRPTSDWVDPSARVMLVERVVPGSWAGTPVLDLEAEGKWRIVALTRLGVAQVPTPDLVTQDGDVIHAAVLGDATDAFEAHLEVGPNNGGSH